MLLLADRNFYSYDLFTAVQAAGADLLWRVKGSIHLRLRRNCPTGPISRTSTTPAR